MKFGLSTYAFALFASVSFSTQLSFGQTGALEINQACVDVGCFPGDNPGFPVTVTESGTAFLTSNLTVPDTVTTAVVLATDNISFDLNRFSIIGPVTCTGQPATCSTTGPAVGVDGGFEENLRVTNGTISGFSQWGVVTGPNGYISKIVVRESGGNGIVARAGTEVTNVKAIQNQGIGVVLRDNAIASGVVSTGNGTGAYIGCVLDAGCSQLVNANLTRNELGVYDWGGGVLRDSIVSFNTGRGILNINGSSSYFDNTIMFNLTDGMSVGGGLEFGAPAPAVVIRGNTISGNANNIVIQVGATLIDAGGNSCGNTAACPN